MPVIFFRSTTPEAAAAILKDGFRDNTAPYLTGEYNGIWLANRPFVLRNVLSILLMICAIGCSTSKPPLDFKVIEKQDISYAVKKRMVYRVVVSVEQRPS